MAIDPPPHSGGGGPRSGGGGVARQTHRTFALYAFLLAFAMQLYLLTALLYPDNIAEYDGYGDYFLKRRVWFFGLIASVQVFDVIDTLIKGANHASQYHWT